MTPCEELGYKVGDEFVVLETREGFTKGQTVNLYRDDGSDMPLFIGSNTKYSRADGKEGACLSLQYVKNIMKEKQMFNMKTQPWFIKVNNGQEFYVIEEWLKENYGKTIPCDYHSKIALVTNVDSRGAVCVNLMWSYDLGRKEKQAQEIKLNFKTIIESVEYPETESEQDKKIRELQETIEIAKRQIEELKGIK